MDRAGDQTTADYTVTPLRRARCAAPGVAHRARVEYSLATVWYLGQLGTLACSLRSRGSRPPAGTHLGDDQMACTTLRWRSVLLLVLLGLATAGMPARATEPAGIVALVSDIHFNPFA